MDAAAVFQQGLGSVVPRQPQYFYHPHPHPQSHPHPHAHPHPHPHPHPNPNPQVHPPFPQPVQPVGPLRRPPTQQRDDDDGNSHRIAHTLTACCRCRQASTLRLGPDRPACTMSFFLFGHRPLSGIWPVGPTFLANDAQDLTMLTHTPFSECSARHDAIPHFPDVCPANGPALSASTSTPQEERRSAGSTSSSCRRRFDSSRQSYRNTPTKTSTIPRVQKISYDQVAWSSSTRRTRHHAI